MEVSAIGERIRAKRLALGLKQNQTTVQLGWKYSRLSMMETGNMHPSIEDVKELSAVFGCSIGEILGESDNGNVKFLNRPIQRIPLLNLTAFGLETFVDIETVLQNADKFMMGVGEELTVKTFAIEVEGDSMTSLSGELPSFPQGTFIFIDPERAYKSGDFVICRNNTGSAIFKKLTTDGSNWFLKSLNPIYPVVQIGSIKQQIVGVVIQSQTVQQY